MTLNENDCLVFLDVDGVLNSADFFDENFCPLLTGSFWEREAKMLDKNCIARLNRLTSSVDAKIVLSSTWRMHFDSTEAAATFFNKLANVHGEFVGMTPILHTPRGIEIQAWLDENAPNCERFVILDDDDDMEHLTDHFVQTSFDTGLSDANVVEAIKLLT